MNWYAPFFVMVILVDGRSGAEAAGGGEVERGLVFHAREVILCGGGEVRVGMADCKLEANGCVSSPVDFRRYD